MASPTSIRRRRAVSEFVGLVSRTLADREKVAERYLLSDFSDPK